MSKKLKVLKSTSGKDYKALCLEVLKSAGFRITKARIAVIECIASSLKPLSAPELYQSLLDKKVKVDKVSVYRVLETLTAQNLVHRVGPSGDYMACNHIECKNFYHVISRCTDCNDVTEVDVPSEVVAPLLFHMKNSLSFQPDSHLLQMDGVCKECVE